MANFIFAPAPKSIDLHRAIAADDFKMLKQLVDTGELDVNFDAAGHNKAGYYVGTPLRQAAIHGNMDCVIYLLQHGADIHRDSIVGRDSILHKAAKYGHLKVLQYLVEEYGLKASSAYPTPLDLAAEHGTSWRSSNTSWKSRDITRAML